MSRPKSPTNRLLAHQHFLASLTQRNKLQWNLIGYAKISIQENAFVKVVPKCWKCIHTAAELGWNSFFKTLICWILKDNRHKISIFSIYVGIFAWLATKKQIQTEVIWYQILSRCYCWMSFLIVLLCNIILLNCYASMSFPSLSMYS